MLTRRTPTKESRAAPPRAGFARGDRVVVTGAGREWTGKIASRRMPDGRDSIHPQYDDTAVFVTFDETGISMAVALRQVAKRER